MPLMDISNFLAVAINEVNTKEAQKSKPDTTMYYTMQASGGFGAGM